LTLNDGGIATYIGGSGTNALSFRYTVGAGENTASLAATLVNLNGATVQNSLGDLAVLLVNGVAQSGPQIDTTPPTVTSVVASGTGINAGNGDRPAGSVITLTVNLNEAVTVAGGAPKLTLNNGGTATYTGGSGSNALTFTYTVASGQSVGDLAVTAFSAGTAAITDAAGTAADLSGAVTNPAGTLQIDTSTHLVQVGNNFALDNVAGSGPTLKYSGSAVTVGQLGTWTPFAVIPVASGYEVALKNASTDQFSIWNTDSNGNFLSFSVYSGMSTALETLETSFNQDLNGDGVIGVFTAEISASGTTKLDQVGNNYFLDPVAGGTGPELKYNGAAVVVGQFAPYTPVGVVQTSGGYEVALKNASTNQFSIWNTDSNGNFLSFSVYSGTSTALETLETTFNQDLNGDGQIGIPKFVIQTDGSTALTQVGNNYFLNNTSSGTGPELKYNGAAVTVGQFSPYTPVGVEQTSSGYEVALKNASTDQFSIWNTDSNGNFLSFSVYSGMSTALETLENTFQQDLNGDGIIGIYAAPGTTLQTNNPLSGPSGSATIGAGARLELAGANASSVAFSGSTGTLTLDNPSTFNGVIFGFSGKGTPSTSDQVDLKGINFNTVRDSYSNGVLTVTDGTHSAALDFNGSYTLANFKLVSDGSGGTIVYDPPATAGQGGDLQPEIMHDPAVTALDQQLALFSQHMASAFPSSAIGNDSTSIAGATELGGVQQSQISQPVANQQHS
jgi:large repetitive protein